MKLISTLLLLAALPAMAQTMRIGTIHKPSVVVAFYRSPVWSDILKKIVDPQEGKKAQDLAHRQLAGEAPIGNILEALAPGWPEIARQAHVAAVAVDLPYADASVQTVDVTEQVLDWLKADERTRKIVRELRK